MRRGKSPASEKIKTNVQTPTNSWVFAIKEDAFEYNNHKNETTIGSIVRLRHPNTNESAQFLISPSNKVLHEILAFKPENRSWFIGKSVKSDGSLYYTTPFDPIFIVLPYLIKECSDKAVPLENLLIDSEFPETRRLIECEGLKQLKLVADQKGDENLKAFKYNEEKTINWLNNKTKRVSDVLKKQQIHVTSGVASSTFIKPTDNNTNDASYLQYAHGIISDYLPEDLSKKLRKHLNLPEESEAVNHGVKRKSSTPTESEGKKSKGDSVGDFGSPTFKIEKATKPTAAKSKEKAFQKAASGSRSITSFFKKV